jgi:hypothetical protein
MTPHEVWVRAADQLTPGDNTEAVINTKVKNTLSEAIPVEIVSGSTADSINQTGEQLLVASGSETTVATYTVPAGKIFYIERVEYDGTNLSVYRVKIDGVKQAQKRTYWTGGFSGHFEFTLNQSTGLSAAAGQVVILTAIHSAASTSDYFARIQGSLRDV